MSETIDEKKELHDEFEKLFGEKYWTNPVCHGEYAFASWKYLRWLEDELEKSRMPRPAIGDVEEMAKKLQEIRYQVYREKITSLPVDSHGYIDQWQVDVETMRRFLVWLSKGE